MSKLVIGCGYLGLRVARRWREKDREVFALTRSSRRAELLSAEGLRPLIGDVTQPATLAGLPSVETLLYAVGFDASAGLPIGRVYVGGLANVLSALPATIGRLIHISSTGVYGDAVGDWVDERTECHPSREGGVACLQAEALLRSHPLGQRAVILRMAGIYGPGRIPRREDLQAGRPIAAPRDGYLNLIHVSDAASVVMAAEQFAPLPRMYVVSDGHPPRREDYYRHLAELLAAPPPQFTTPPPQSPAAQRSAADKRIDNSRLLQELPIRLAFPTYREGLADIVSQE